jgi:hypothetical protein
VGRIIDTADVLAEQIDQGSPSCGAGSGRRDGVRRDGVHGGEERIDRRRRWSRPIDRAEDAEPR